MRVIKPITVTDSKLTSSTIPEPDAGETVWAPYTSAVGDRRINTTTHRIYEATVASTDDPIDGISETPPTWVNVAPTNKWAMFDAVNSTQSSETTQLIVEVNDDKIVNSIAGFSIEGATSINVTVTDPISGVVYDRDIDMVDNFAVADWYYYYFSPIVNINEFALLDLPAYPAATIKITINGNNIKLGSLIFGNQLVLGVANYGTSVQLLDFSKKEADEFGNIVVTKGRSSKLVDFDVSIEKNRVNYVFGVISSITTMPSVWVGDDGTSSPTLVFGYYRDYQNNISTPTITDATITVEGLV